MSSSNIIASYSFGGHLLNTDSVSWSEDNSLALIFSKGVYIIETRTDPSECSDPLQHHKSSIECQDEVMNFDVDIDIKQLMRMSTLDEQNLLMLDHTLTPNSANSPSFTCYRLAAWSFSTRKFGCCLALLTLDHRIVIYQSERSRWKKSVDLSLLLNQVLKESWPTLDQPSYKVYKERVYSLATTAICWGEKRLTEDLEWCFFYSASKNGLITFWQVLIEDQIRIELFYKWKTDFGQITCLKCFENYLIVSTFSGIVFLICTEFKADDPPIPLILWSEEDGVTVSHFEAKRIDSTLLEVVVMKGVFLVICRVESSKVSDSIVLALRLCRVERGLHQMPATGICPLIDGQYLVSACDGSFSEISISRDLELNQKQVVLNTNPKGIVTFGLASSRNCVLFCAAQMLSVYHDHLSIKEPVKLLIVSNISYERLIKSLEQLLDTESSSSFNSIVHCQDYFDFLRHSIRSNNCPFPEELLPKILNLTLEDKSWKSSFQLKIVRFLAKFFEENTTQKIVEIDQLEKQVTLCEDLLLKLHIKLILEAFSVDQANQVTDSARVFSLSNMISWMSLRFRISYPNFHFKNVKDKEKCPICGKAITFGKRSADSCPDGHEFKRCCNSLLLCDIVNNKYEKCVRCFKSLIVVPVLWGPASVCLYCS